MSLPDSLAGLLRPEAYPHPCARVELVETHISWVLLTGDFAYKLKKPVKFPFVDFSTLERRAFFCGEELRCNRTFAPDLYLEVVPVTRDGGQPRMAGDGAVVEWAVKMRQFPRDAQLDVRLEREGLPTDVMAAFGRTLARQHHDLPARTLAAAELDKRVLKPARDNFDDVAALSWIAPRRTLLETVRHASEAAAGLHPGLLAQRLEQGWTRECHGDLHLANLVLLEGEVRAFDCLEFNPDLRWIDPQSDVAFLLMDCLVRGAAEPGYAFLDGYLDASGDYQGATLLPFYAAYRSMVRAKVAALRREQAPGPEGKPYELRFLTHLRWAADWLRRDTGTLVLMCGVSGSGKSYLAERLAPRLPALRLRSDVARKRLSGLDPTEPATAAVGAGIYQAERSGAVYGWLETLAEDLLRSGEHVIIDATFLLESRRQPFVKLARRLGARLRIVYCDAPEPVLEARVRHRAAAGGDASDANLPVLRHQLATLEMPSDAVCFDSGTELDHRRLGELAETLLDRRDG